MTEPERPTPAFHDTLGIRSVLQEKGRARYELTVGPEHLNRRGVSHGGVVASLLDVAMGSAVVSSIRREEWTGTIELSIQFREPVRMGVVTVEGRMARRGRTAAFAEGEVRDQKGRLLATAHGIWTIWPSKPD